MEAEQAYLEAIRHGRYSERIGELRGKYDHVRTQWEDFITGHYLGTYLEEIVKEKKDRNNGGLRFFDIGCGAGDGYELLSNLSGESKLSQLDTRLIPRDLLECYKGVDINTELLKEGKNFIGHYDHVDLYKGDFSCGLPVEEGEPPYDLYFTSYGTLSHCSDKELEKLLSDTARHAQNGSLIAGDFIGRYSYEWQNLWTDKPEELKNIDYKINYLYSDEARDNVAVSSFPLRLMTPGEVSAIVERATAGAGVELKVLCFFDRSFFIGRHIETGTYNDNPQPIRSMVSSLFEPGLRTFFTDLLVEYIPRDGFTWQNRAFELLADSWNKLIKFTMRLLERYDEFEETGLPETPPSPIPCLSKAFRVMRHTLIHSKGLYGDIRADLIEAQLGLALLSLEMEMQKGTGLGHGLVAIIKVVK